MKTTILSASLLLLLSSCTPTKTTNNLNAIDIAGSFEHLTELKVSQLGKNIRYGEFYQFNLSSCIRQQNSLTAQFVSFSLANLANIFYPPPDFYNN